MPLNVRSISVSVAVICFFGIAIVGWISELSPFTCCRRALTAAIIAYAVTVLAVKTINIILIDAMAKSRTKQQEGEAGVSGD